MQMQQMVHVFNGKEGTLEAMQIDAACRGINVVSYYDLTYQHFGRIGIVIVRNIEHG